MGQMLQIVDAYTNKSKSFNKYIWDVILNEKATLVENIFS